MKNQERTFKDWTTDELLLLGFTKKKQCKFLDEWLVGKSDLQDWQKHLVNQLLLAGEDATSNWNEQELLIKLISPILTLVGFDSRKHFFSAFSERMIETNYKGINLKGKVDWMVAAGQIAPILPFFFIHEYKKEKAYSNDPRGQLLATMLAAQVLNQTIEKPTLFKPYNIDKYMPIYGCYIVGRFWYFVVLHKQEYCVSKYYDATDEKELLQIIAILKKQKQMIINRIETARKAK